jgi:hypothetical protein
MNVYNFLGVAYSNQNVLNRNNVLGLEVLPQRGSLIVALYSIDFLGRALTLFSSSDQELSSKKRNVLLILMCNKLLSCRQNAHKKVIVMYQTDQLCRFICSLSLKFSKGNSDKIKRKCHPITRFNMLP